jgi:glycosyltransferase involved in cell wall biosynthesis
MGDQVRAPENGVPPPGGCPRITIAVPSYNQGKFIRETLESLVEQQYPNLEVIIQDGGSTDGAVEIAQEFAARLPGTFRLYVQKDRGHAHALNMAFARSTGEILGYLNTDDTLYPGCLRRVAREIDPARGRYIVFGRCLFTGEGSPYVGREHPAQYHGHFDLLAVWKRGHNAIPQPSTFWHRSVYETCGGFDEEHNHGLDYLQWCKFSRRYRFHKVDALWSTYRMHPVSVTANKTEREWLDIMIRYSRMHWGPWWHPLRWRCEVSCRFHDRDRYERARRHAQRAEQAIRAGRYGEVLRASIRAFSCSPRLVLYRVARRLPAMGLGAALRRARPDASGSVFAGRYSDNWIGPVYRSEVSVPTDASRLIMLLEHHPQGHHHLRASPALLLDGKVVDRRRMNEPGRLSLVVPLAPYRGNTCTLEVRTPEFFIPRFVSGDPDDRRLSLMLLDQRIE